MLQSVEKNGHMLEGTERPMDVRPKTRSQGKIEDHDWVLGKTIEHRRKLILKISELRKEEGY